MPLTKAPKSEAFALLKDLSANKPSPYDLLFFSKYYFETQPHLELPRYDTFLLYHEAIYLYASKSSEIARRKSISLSALASLPLIAYPSGSSTDFAQIPFLRDALAENIRFSSNNFALCKRYLSQNKAFMLGSPSIYNALLDKKEIAAIPFQENLQVAFLFAVPQRRPEDVQVFSETVLSFYATTAFPL